MENSICSVKKTKTKLKVKPAEIKILTAGGFFSKMTTYLSIRVEKRSGWTLNFFFFFCLDQVQFNHIAVLEIVFDGSACRHVSAAD